MSTLRIPKVLEIKPDPVNPQIHRLYIDGELFPWGTIQGVTIGPISKGQLPNVTLSIVGERVKLDWDIFPEESEKASG